jgi:hypothetical protein
LITAQDIAIPRAQPALHEPRAPAAAAFTERLLLVVLYITVLASSIAFIEPSPHDGLMAVLALACLIAGVRFDRHVALLFLLLLTFNVAGLLSLLNVPGQLQTVQYAATSIYLALAAVLFASLLARNTMTRITAVRSAYVLTATIVALAGTAGYFSLFPHAHDLFTEYDRAVGTFKDPNVFGPFLIWPMLVLVERMLTRSVRLLDLVSLGILIVGLLLSFSRGAWFHFAVSCLIMMTLTLLTAPTDAARMRIMAIGAVGIAVLAAFVVILLSFDSISHMFFERAQLLQPYDVGSGGRFRLQEFALTDLLNFPNGMGPFQFNVVHGMQQHNVYLQAFLVYGWAGAMAYFTLLGATVWMALRAAFVRTPWQPYLFCAFGAFVGEIVEGFVIDTDHWRHFFLLLGMVWGLAAATLRHVRDRPPVLARSR